MDSLARHADGRKRVATAIPVLSCCYTGQVLLQYRSCLAAKPVISLYNYPLRRETSVEIAGAVLLFHKAGRKALLAPNG